MANKIQIKRSSTSGKAPVIGDLDLGELAINTNDGKLYLKQTVGATNNIVLVGGSRVYTEPNGTLTTLPINADIMDVFVQENTASAGTITLSNPTGTFRNNQRLLVKIKTTNAQNISFGNAYAGSTDLSTSGLTMAANTTNYLGFMYDSTALKWQLIAKNFGF
jgi:hypothetical protein